jgi:hypothetical protein
MLMAIAHHRFGSPIWGKDEVRKLRLELAEIDILAMRLQRQLTEPADSGWPQCRQLPL